ncbi:MAG: hypothetical protein EHM28_08330 [Spirochaetaceae bacterium]|nr:MAG: hypothetical protein EHM28_08330 [Spirochaetaceae bacterium]
MSLSKKNPLGAIFTYPPTWAVIGLIAVFHLVFTLIFAPGMIFSIIALVVDFLGYCTWFVIAFKSEDFKKHFNKMPYENRTQEIGKVVAVCPEPFRKPASESLALIDRVTREFPDQTYSFELESMVSNIRELAVNYKTLADRAQHFGDADQKKRMESIMNGQINALNTTLSTLKTFSGNLTLLAASEEQSQAATDQLKDINQGLKEVIEEL